MTRPATATTDAPSGLDFRIGIDVGGTWIKGAIINMGSGTPVGGVRQLRTPASGTVDAVADILNQLIDELGSESLGHTDAAVGVAIPSIVQHGVAMSAANMDDSWIGLDVQAYLREQLGRPVCVMNDADAAGMAETHYGAGKDKHGVVLVLTLGTGIGSALIVDGKLVPNFELGHLEIDGLQSRKQANDGRCAAGVPVQIQHGHRPAQRRALLLMAPTIIVFLLLQKQFSAALLQGAVKG